MPRRPLFLGTLIIFTYAPLLCAQPTCPPGQIVHRKKCVECPIGTYRKNKTSCEKCPPGTAQPRFGAVAVDLCRNCSPGTYSDMPASPTCMPCPGGTTSNFAATKCSACGPGTAAAFYGDGCDLCERGSYSTGTANQKCQFCPWPLSSKPGSKTPKACKPCPPGKHANSCTTCSKNWFKSLGMDRCIPCPPGTFTRRDGATSENHCIPCPPNTFFSRSSEGCRPCKTGTTANGPGATFCRPRGAKCFQDFFENENGDCERCAPGWKYVEAESRCERCPIGYASKGGKQTTCIKCVDDMLPGFNNRICTCPPGKFFVSSRLCLPCPAGADVEDSLGHTHRECFKCTKGTFKRRAGTQLCERCPFGMVALKEGSTKCMRCGAGTMPDLDMDPINYIHGSAQCVSTKTRCPLGYRRKTVGVSRSFFGCKQVACTLETPKEEINKSCAPCLGGYRLVGEGKRCSRCPRREVSDGGIIAECKMCRNGLFQDERDRSKCSCYGYFALGFGIQDGKCEKCPPGTFGAYTSEACSPCGAGTFAKGIGNEGCKSCPSGSVSGQGASSCKKCPTGKVPDRRFRARKCVVEM